VVFQFHAVNLKDFLEQRSPDWEALRQGLRRARGRPERLGLDGALELGRRYRATVADLAYARRRFPGDPVVANLEQTVLAGRQAVYGRRARSSSPLRFIVSTYWQLIAARPRLLAAAATATFLPGILAGLWALHDPAAAIGLVPSSFRAAAQPHLHALPGGATTLAVFASSIFTNNIEVAFLVFTGGLALGIVTIAVLAYNGIMVGALAGLTIQSGNFSVFVRYVAPHGFLELSCFTVAGAAGLRLAMALIDPGRLPRGQALRREARPAVAIVVGTAMCLVVAGLTEGFVTPHALPVLAALAVGVFLGGGFWSLIWLRGFRSGHEASP
jgi:uncharacterized membrane protein SpoIIM required for sporulation